VDIALTKDVKNLVTWCPTNVNTPDRERSLPDLYVLILVAAIPIGGCYRYTPIEFHEAQRTEEVRAHLFPGGVSEAERIFGARHHHLDGKVEWVDTGRIVLRVRHSNHPGSSREAVLQQRVDLSRDQVRFVELIELDRTKTYAVTAAGVAVTVAALILRFSGRTGGTSPPPGNGPDV
jgi:hypothetical protein